MSKSLTLLAGDNLESLRRLAANGVLVDSVVTDPPYGLSFMGKKWDYQVPSVEFWRLVYAVLKPGGHVLSFGGTRTYHRMACALEDAGFEIRDQLAWIYGSGFPKSLDVSKAIDKAAGAKRAVIGSKVGKPGYSLAAGKGSTVYGSGFGGQGDSSKECDITAPATPAARPGAGFARAIKPACEPIALARKPLDGKNTVASNVLAFRTGALNIDGCRIGTVGADRERHLNEWNRVQSKAAETGIGAAGLKPIDLRVYVKDGRWPANVLLDADAAAVLDAQSGVSRAATPRTGGFRDDESSSRGCIDFKSGSRPTYPNVRGDAGGASRFFYCAKASARERAGSTHPTVKPVALMRYLCRLVTPRGGTILDPFAGSGTTGEAALREGFSVVLMEREAAYIADIRRRLGAGEAAA